MFFSFFPAAILSISQWLGVVIATCINFSAYSLLLIDLTSVKLYLSAPDTFNYMRLDIIPSHYGACTFTHRRRSASRLKWQFRVVLIAVIGVCPFDMSLI